MLQLKQMVSKSVDEQHGIAARAALGPQAAVVRRPQVADPSFEATCGKEIGATGDYGSGIL